MSLYAERGGKSTSEGTKSGLERRDPSPPAVHSVDSNKVGGSASVGHLHTTPSFCRVHGDVTHGGLGGFVSCPYSFPQQFTNHFF